MKPVFIILFIITLLYSCNFPEPLQEWSGDVSSTEFQTSTILFTKDNQNNEYKFYTNDKDNIRPYGKSFWLPLNNIQTPFIKWEVECCKISGNKYSGFGIIFAQDKYDGVESMLCAMIRIDGYFQIAEVIGSDYQPLNTQWTYSNAINRGYGSNNRLKVKLDSSANYTFYINDNEVYSFKDIESPIHNRGYSGYIVVTSPEEDFPSFPVEVRYKKP